MFRFHQVRKDVVDACQVASALGFEPLENLRVEADAHGYFAPDVAQPHQLCQLLAVKRGMSRKLMSESLPDAWRPAARRSACLSFSVHFLFLISSDLMVFSPAGRDDTDDFFILIVLPIYVDNQEPSGSRRKGV